MPLCAVITCKCSQEGHDGEAEGIMFHPFPPGAELRAKWVEMTGRSGWSPTLNDYVCSRHFREHDYTIKRSRKRYLKISAVPCEYVVYSNLFGEDEQIEVKVEAEEKPTDKPAPAPAAQSVKVEPERSWPKPFALMDLPYGNEEPDSTITLDEWERFQTARYFSDRPPSIFEEDFQNVRSSGLDDSFRRDVASSSNPYPPLDLHPELQQLPPPRTPEPPIPSAEEKVERIEKIMSKRKSSKKEQDNEPQTSRRRTSGRRFCGVSSSTR